MSILNINGFDFYTDLQGKAETFIVKGENLPLELNFIKQNKIRSIAINYFDSKFINDLKFLTEIKFIEDLTILDFDFSYHDIYLLENLKTLNLSIKSKNQKLDYSKFPMLEILSIDWYNGFPDLSKNSHLKELAIWKFKPKSKDFSELILPPYLQKLHITESNILNLKGLEQSNLKEFEAHYCNSLKTLDGIDKFKENLKVLILDYCRKLNNYEDLKHAINLEKLILGDCGDLPSINWLKELKKLKHFSFYNTKLLDGDTSPCFGIEYVSFKNQKNYNYKKEDFKIN